MDEPARKFVLWAAKSSGWKSFLVWYLVCLVMNAGLIYCSLVERTLGNFMLVFKPVAVSAIAIVLVLNFLWLKMVRKMVE
jgi:hypothetical protein